MIPVYLRDARLISALGEDLDSAVDAYHAGRLPEPEWFCLNELGERRPYLPVRGQTQRLEQRLDALLDSLALGKPRDCLLVLASTALDIAELERQAAQGATLDNRMSTPLDKLASDLRQRWGFAAAYTLNTACTSAANGLLYAARLLDLGRYRRAVVLAFETPSAITRQGFGVLELTSRSGRYRPFHPERDGLVLGESYAAVRLDAEPGPQPLARLLGGYSACDTSSLTATQADGSHIEAVVRQALASAGLNPAQIALAKLHGTATTANDEAEHNGMRRVFGEHLPPLAVLKPYLGHTLGACGLSETLLLMRSLAGGALPPVAYAREALLPLPSGPTRVAPATPLLANYFGFGGNNASLILQGLPPCA